MLGCHRCIPESQEVLQQILTLQPAEKRRAILQEDRSHPYRLVVHEPDHKSEHLFIQDWDSGMSGQTWA